MSEGLQNRFFKIFMLWLAVAVVAVGLYLAWPYFVLRRALIERDAELVTRLERKRAEIVALQESQRRFRSDPEFVEAIARQNHRVFPGELVFIFDEK